LPENAPHFRKTCFYSVAGIAVVANRRFTRLAAGFRVAPFLPCARIVVVALHGVAPHAADSLHALLLSVTDIVVITDRRNSRDAAYRGIAVFLAGARVPVIADQFIADALALSAGIVHRAFIAIIAVLGRELVQAPGFRNAGVRGTLVFVVAVHGGADTLALDAPIFLRACVAVVTSLIQGRKDTPFHRVARTLRTRVAVRALQQVLTGIALTIQTVIPNRAFVAVKALIVVVVDPFGLAYRGRALPARLQLRNLAFVMADAAYQARVGQDCVFAISLAVAYVLGAVLIVAAHVDSANADPVCATVTVRAQVSVVAGFAFHAIGGRYALPLFAFLAFTTLTATASAPIVPAQHALALREANVRYSIRHHIDRLPSVRVGFDGGP